MSQRPIVNFRCRSAAVPRYRGAGCRFSRIPISLLEFLFSHGNFVSENEILWVYEVPKAFKLQLSLKIEFSCENYSLRENMGLRGVEHRENGNLRQSGREKSSFRKKNGV